MILTWPDKILTWHHHINHKYDNENDDDDVIHNDDNDNPANNDNTKAKQKIIKMPCWAATEHQCALVNWMHLSWQNRELLVNISAIDFYEFLCHHVNCLINSVDILNN